MSLDTQLLKGEVVRARVAIHPILTYGPATVLAVLIGIAIFVPHAAIVAGVLAVVPLTHLVRSIIYMMSTEALVTDQRLLVSTGLLSKNFYEIPHRQSEGMTVNLPLLGRILGYGSIEVSGTGTDRLVIRTVADPMAFRRAYQEAVSAAGARLNPQ